MRKKTQNYLIELLLVFFALANFSIFSTTYGYYGANNLSITRIMPAQRNLADQRMRAAGMEWAREEFNWGLINPSRNKWYWANPDQAMGTHRRNGVQVVGMIAYTSPWASTCGGADAQFCKPNIDQWKNYVGAVARRYGDITHWEIWNEPNHYWKPSPNTDEYREVLVAAYDTIKSINPNAKVASGGTTYIDNSFIDSFLDNGGWEHLDAVAVHYYPGVGPESDPNNKLRDELLKLEYNTIVPHGGLKEIWVTEMGWQSDQIGLEAQADVISRATIIARTVNEAPITLIYNLRDDPTGSWGLLKNNFQPKLSYNYYQKTVQFIGNRWPAQLLELNDGSKFYVFDGPGGPVAAAWNPGGVSTIGFHVNSSSIRCYDIAGGSTTTTNTKGRAAVTTSQSVDVTSRVVKSWNSGDVTLEFAPRPIFCQLSNFSAQNTEPSGTNLPKVAGASVSPQILGVSTALTKEEKTETTVSGKIQGQLSKVALLNSKTTVFRQTDTGAWQRFIEATAPSGNYNFKLKEGKYFLASAAPGYLTMQTQPFEVKGDSDISFQTSLFNLWLAYGILVAGFVILILFVIKYTRKKT